MAEIYLNDIAHGRSGDKGDTSNVCVYARKPEYYKIIEREVTPEKLKAFFGDICLILNQMIGTLSIAEAQKFTVMIVIQQMYTAFSQTLSSSIQTVCQIFYIVHVAVIIAIHTSQDNFIRMVTF